MLTTIRITKRFLSWLLSLLTLGKLGRGPQSSRSALLRTIVPILIYPSLSDAHPLNTTQTVAEETYYVSAPWVVDISKVTQAIGVAESWLNQALGASIPWSPLRVVASQVSLAGWRSGKITLLRDEVEGLGLPWIEGYVYLAFVRGMGGYAGGVGHQDGNPGYAIVGDICVEAICQLLEPTAGSVLLGTDGWPPNSYALDGQTGAFTHEVLHGLGLGHPEDWPEGNRPGADETIMGNWWNMPNFVGTDGLTHREGQKVLERPF